MVEIEFELSPLGLYLKTKSTQQTIEYLENPNLFDWFVDIEQTLLEWFRMSEQTLLQSSVGM
ncbi:MAG: hypothetical protein ATN34_02590 [Epulopiscium sp. Nele67-Bin002]|nr:MAG: hypothetical protein ATN34_02590 [Epulopiscium sp. Nele67-Bin002]